MTFDTDVFIAGAGPVGLTAAMDLSQRGVRVTLAEPRRFAEPPNVKCNHVSARSMEIFRRLGVAEAVRNAGLPADHPNDVVFRTSVTGIELTRIPIPCRRDRYTAASGPDTGWPTAEPPHRINQIYMEPVLFAHAAGIEGLQILNRTAFEDWPEPARKRHLLRLWLAPEDARPLPPVFAERYGSVVPGARGGVMVARLRLNAPLKVD